MCVPCSTSSGSSSVASGLAGVHAGRDHLLRVDHHDPVGHCLLPHGELCRLAFGRELVDKPNAGIWSFLGNVIWVIVAGWWLALTHITRGSCSASRSSEFPGNRQFKLIRFPDAARQADRPQALPFDGSAGRALDAYWRTFSNAVIARSRSSRECAADI